MFKVVLVLKQITIRLKQCELDVLLRKNKENVVLCSKLRLYNGTCPINLVKEFYIDADDCIITLIIYIFLGIDKRYAGEVTLNVFQWEENVIHATQSKITNCPDKGSRIKFEFYYFRDDKIIDNRVFFMSQEKHKQQYNLIENSNKVLTAEKQKLQEEVFNWHKRNEVLEASRQDMMINMSQRQIYHQSQKGNYQSSINQYSQQFEKQKGRREDLIKLVGEYGIDQSGWRKQ